MASEPRPSWGLGLGGRGARGCGRVSVWPGPGHVRVRTPPPLASRPGPARLAAHHGLHPEPPHRGRGGHRHPGELGLSLPAEVR